MEEVAKWIGVYSSLRGGRKGKRQEHRIYYCEICKCYVRLSYITEDGICFECNEIKQDVVVECGVCANRFEQSEIDQHGMCSKCRTEFKQCELCKYYALDRDDNFNADGVCIVCLNPSLLEE